MSQGGGTLVCAESILPTTLVYRRLIYSTSSRRVECIRPKVALGFVLLQLEIMPPSALCDDTHSPKSKVVAPGEGRSLALCFRRQPKSRAGLPESPLRNKIQAAPLATRARSALYVCIYSLGMLSPDVPWLGGLSMLHLNEKRAQ